MENDFCDYWLMPIENVYEIEEEYIDCNFDCDECHYCSASREYQEVNKEEV